MKICIFKKTTFTAMQNWQERISLNPEVRVGKPCITGTRITVWDILGWLASDMTYDEILEDFPALTRADIMAALAFHQK